MNILDIIKDPNKYYFIQAPLAGVTNRAFRRLVKDSGADAVVSEMVSMNGLIHHNKRTYDMLHFEEIERPFGIQLFGGDINNVQKTMELVLEVRPDFIDLNCGCPVKKIIKQGAGSFLLKDPSKIFKIVSLMKQNSCGIPISAKIRSGWDMTSINYLETGKAIEDAGADFIAFHARTRSQLYDGLADWDMIAELNSALSIPLIGNGDIKNVEDFKEKAESRGIKKVMIGRGAYENPYIYKELKSYVENGENNFVWSLDNRIKMIFKHIEYLKKYNPNISIVPFIKKHIAWYLKGLPGVKDMRREIFALTTYEDLLKMLKKIEHNGAL